MMKREYTFSLFFILFSLVLNAQDFNKKIVLEWNDNSELISSHTNNHIKLPLLKKRNFDKNFIPFYFEQWTIGSNLDVDLFRIKNIVFKEIDKNIFLKESQEHFSTEIQSSFVIKKARNQTFAQLKLIPLVLDNGILKRIISFELDYKFKPKALKRNFSSVHNSPLSSGDWYKFAVDTTGVFKLDRSFLNSIGVDLSGVNPKNIKLFGNGGARLPEANSAFRYVDLQENAIYIKGEEDNSFDNNDYILFYAQGPNTWLPNLNTNTATHQKNIYDDKAYYFIHVANNLGKRVQPSAPLNQVASSTITTFNDYAVHELEKENLDNFGQQFFGENFTVNDTQNFSLDFTDIDLSQNISVKLSVGAVSDTNTNFELNYNSQNIINLNVGSVGYTTIGATTYQAANFTAINEVLDFELKFLNNGNPSAKGFLDYIEVNGIKKLIARDKQFSFRNYSLANSVSTNYEEFIIENKDNIKQIWNVTDRINPMKIENTSSNSDFTFVAQGGELQEYILINNLNYYSPIKLNSSYVANQNLHAIQDIDYLIITKDELLNQANRIADFYKNNQNLSTLVLTEQTIYNEFSSGGKDPVAIRDFIKHLYNNASANDKRIKYVLMFGDTSFDFQNIEGNNRDVNVIAYQSKNSTSLASSYVTDDFFVMLDDNEGEFYNSNGSGDLIDVAVGRMPVKNRSEAVYAVDKVLNYYNEEAFGKWRNHIALVADDVDNASSDFGLVIKVEQVADLIKQYKPVYNLTKIYADSYVQQISSGGQSYPQVREAINNAVERGSLIIDYFGHGGENGWGSERLLDVPQIHAWHNINTLPLFITITCEFSRFDNPVRVAAGESVFSNPNGGAISMITTARAVYISFGGEFNIDLMADLLAFNTTDEYSIAESLVKSKNSNASQTQRLFINYFGDPAMKLARPKSNVKVTHMNNIDASQDLDTIKALSHVHFKGVVTDNNDNLLTNFNGELSVIVYDKSEDRTTLNNDNNFINGNPTIITFDSRESKIFNGKATVENGLWEFDFIAPRDIRIAYGNAKLSFYANDETIDKNGYTKDIIIGGINYDAPEDNIGPTIKLYMNDESFIDGGNTNESPLFLAILEDESGINTSLTAVDHDIVAILDGDQSNPIIMNDYYETEADNFRKGKVKFPFRDLSVGLHTITFKCWDTYNNPSEASVSFVVVSDSELVLDNVLNYPNPFINYTEFWFNHNKPGEALEAQVQIFTVSGKLIKTINEQVLTNGTLSRSIKWNGLDDFGNKIGKGVYIYKLSVMVVSSGLKAKKIEKLVILQ